MSEAIDKAILENIISISNMHADDAAWLRAALSQAGQGGQGEVHHWIVPDFGFLFPTEESAKRYLANIGSNDAPIACYAALPAPVASVAMTPEQREFFNAGYEAAQRDADVCDVPPLGWHCTRKAGHDSPCAAVQNDDAELVQRGMDRLREGAQRPAPAVPAGWQLVPVDPTLAMLDEGWGICGGDGCASAEPNRKKINAARNSFRALLSAAPKP